MVNSTAIPKQNISNTATGVVTVAGIILLASFYADVDSKPKRITASPEEIAQAIRPGAESALAEKNGAPAQVSQYVSFLSARHPPDESTEPALAALDEIVTQTQAHHSLFDRFEAIDKLGNANELIAESVLVELLSDVDPGIREAALESLAEIGAVDGISQGLMDADKLVRRTAIELLAEIGTRDALSALAMTLNDPSADLRLAALYELSDNDNIASTALMQRFLTDVDPEVRTVAAELLSGAGH